MLLHVPVTSPSGLALAGFLSTRGYSGHSRNLQAGGYVWQTRRLFCYNGRTMIRAGYREALESQHKILVVLWWVFLAGIFLYLWISKTFLTERPLDVSDSFARTAGFVLWLLTLLDLATLMWWKKRFLNQEAILAGVKRYKILQALQEHKTPPEERAAGIVSSYVTGKIVAFALAEAVAIYGFALVLVGRYFPAQYILSAAAGALLVLEFPSWRFLEELLKKAATGESRPEEETIVP